MANHLMPETVPRNYFHAKDRNRPHLLEHVFAPAAVLGVVNRTSTIAFPARSEGLEAIGDVLVRDFGRTYENVCSFFLFAQAGGRARLEITIDAMQLLPPAELGSVLAWVGRLRCPWSRTRSVLRSMPAHDALAPVAAQLRGYDANVRRPA